MRVCIKIFDGKLLHVGKHRITNIFQRALRHISHKPRIGEVADKSRDVDTAKQEDSPEHLRHQNRHRGVLAVGLVNPKSFLNIGNETVHKNGADGVDNRAYRKADKDNNKVGFIVFGDKFENSQKCPLVGFQRLLLSFQSLMLHLRHLLPCFGIHIPRGKYRWKREAPYAFRWH